MSVPDHAIWKELETYFRTRIVVNERGQIIEIIRQALAESPEVDLDHLTLKVTAAVLKKRS